MRSTFSRTFFPAAVLLLAALLLVGFSFQLLIRDYLTEQALDSLEGDGRAISALASAYHSKSSLSDQEFRVNLSLLHEISGADAVIFDAHGELVMCSDAPFGCEHRGWTLEKNYLQQVLSKGKIRSIGTLSGLYSDDRYVVSLPVQGNGHRAVGVVMVSQSAEDTVRVLERMSNIFLSVSVVTVLIAIGIMSFFARRQSRPLKELANAAIAFGHGDLTARVQRSHAYTREIEELALAFNNMADSLQKSEYRRQEFVANVSHELKTPMTTIGGYVDGILDGTIPPEKSRQYMQVVSDETKRLSRLVRSMLDISRLQDQGGIPEEMKSRFDVTECIGSVLITFEQKITEKNLEVDVQMPEYPVHTHACRDHITQVVYNLLDNAVKFCRQDGKLSVNLQVGGNKIYVSVSNDGQTIPAGELPLVFDRFHKTDKSRTQKDGWGLGLYIVKTIVCSHGEDISVSSREGKTTFTFTLPLA